MRTSHAATITAAAWALSAQDFAAGKRRSAIRSPVELSRRTLTGVPSAEVLSPVNTITSGAVADSLGGTIPTRALSTWSAVGHVVLPCTRIAACVTPALAELSTPARQTAPTTNIRRPYHHRQGRQWLPRF
ncbi:MAG: hypothetical protein ABJA82_02215 [Myxococcales bacterium]